MPEIVNLKSPPRGLQRSEHRLLLTIGDAVCAAAAVVLALWAWSITTGFSFDLDFLRREARWFVLVPVWTAVLAPARRFPAALSPRAAVRAVTSAAAVLLVMYSALYFYAPPRALPRLPAVYFLWDSVLLVLAWRLIYMFVVTGVAFRRRAIIVGVGSAAARTVSLLHDHAPDVEVVGAVDAGGEPCEVAVPLVAPADLEALVGRASISEIVVAQSAVAPDVIQALLRWQERGVAVVPMAAEYEQLLGRVPVAHLPEGWLFTSLSEWMRARDASNAVKRLTDVAGALAGLALLALALPLIGVLIWAESGRPIFYRQRRLGAGGRAFELLKFRSMSRDAEHEGPQWAGEDDPRSTRVGRWLRRSRLDELPQVINVLRGDMSLVGPRPERPEFVAQLEQAIPVYRARLMVRPGLTGWAQVNAGYAASSPDASLKLEYDLYYIKHRSFLFDMWIVLKTIATLARLRGR